MIRSGCSECGEPLDEDAYEGLCGYCIDELEAEEEAERRDHERQESLMSLFL